MYVIVSVFLFLVWFSKSLLVWSSDVCIHTCTTLSLYLFCFFCFFCFFLFCSLLVLSHLLNGGLQHCRCCQDVHLCVTCSTLLEQPSVWMSQQTWWVIHREFCAELCALPLMVTSSQAFSLAAMWYSVDWWNAWCLELESSAHCSWFLSSVNVGHYLIWRFCLKSFCFEHNGHVLLCTNLWDKYAGHWLGFSCGTLFVLSGLPLTYCSRGCFHTPSPHEFLRGYFHHLFRNWQSITVLWLRNW